MRKLQEQDERGKAGIHLPGFAARSVSVMAALMLAGAVLCCGTARADEPSAEVQQPTEVTAEQQQEAMQPQPAPQPDLLTFAQEQEGVPYRRGGVSPERGFDCSGFVRYVFGQVEGVVLPHSAKALSLLGEQVAKVDLQPGDLVFFRILRHSISHVGIYLGDNRFIHAASIRTGGVRISDLADAYWAKRFSLARRIEPPAGDAPVADQEQADDNRPR